MSWKETFLGRAQVERFADLDERRLENGNRLLLNDFPYKITFPDGEKWEDTIPAGTISDWSSWPNWLHIPIILPRPREEAMDVAGWVHDRVCTLIRSGELDKSLFWATKFWRYVARSGQGITQTRWYPSWIGAVGLTAWSAMRTVFPERSVS